MKVPIIDDVVEIRMRVKITETKKTGEEIEFNGYIEGVKKKYFVVGIPQSAIVEGE